MRKFQTIHSTAIPWLMPNVDTDTITPMRRLILNMDELDRYSFEPYRFKDGNGDLGILDMDFPLNQKRYEGAQILIVGENFGCGSSRETAAEAIAKCGYYCVMGVSLAGIFTKNCYQMGILPLVLPKETIQDFARQAEALGTFTVDLEEGYLESPEGQRIAFQVDHDRREMLLQGTDEVGYMLSHPQSYERFLEQDRKARPWLYE